VREPHRPAPHPAAQSGYSMGGRVGVRAGTAKLWRMPKRTTEEPYSAAIAKGGCEAATAVCASAASRLCVRRSPSEGARMSRSR